MKKLWREQRGETLVETLCAILVISLTTLFLTTAIVSSGRINKQNAEQDSSFHQSDSAPTSLTVTVKSASGSRVFEAEAKLYESEPLAEDDSYVYRYYR